MNLQLLICYFHRVFKNLLIIFNAFYVIFQKFKKRFFDYELETGIPYCDITTYLLTDFNGYESFEIKPEVINTSLPSTTLC